MDLVFWDKFKSWIRKWIRARDEPTHRSHVITKIRDGRSAELVLRCRATHWAHLWDRSVSAGDSSVRPSVCGFCVSPSGLHTAISWYSNRVTWLSLTPNAFYSLSLKQSLYFLPVWLIRPGVQSRYGSKTASELVEINQRTSGQFVNIGGAELLMNSC